MTEEDKEDMLSRIEEAMLQLKLVREALSLCLEYDYEEEDEEDDGY